MNDMIQQLQNKFTEVKQGHEQQLKNQEKVENLTQTNTSQINDKDETIQKLMYEKNAFIDKLQTEKHEVLAQEVVGFRKDLEVFKTNLIASGQISPSFSMADGNRMQ